MLNYILCLLVHRVLTLLYDCLFCFDTVDCRVAYVCYLYVQVAI